MITVDSPPSPPQPASPPAQSATSPSYPSVLKDRGAGGGPHTPGGAPVRVPPPVPPRGAPRKSQDVSGRVIPRGLQGVKFPRLSPILLLHHPDFLPASVFGRTSASPDSLCSDLGFPPDYRYRTYRKSKSPLSDDLTYCVRSSIPKRYKTKHNSSFMKTNKVPMSPRVATLRRSSPRNQGLPKVDPVINSTIPSSGPLSDEGLGLSKRPQVYYPKKAAAEKRAIMKKSHESLIFHSAESHSGEFKPDHPDFHPDFDSDDLV
ncbi:hypothetical protein J6590_026800 [Homalodisca vitripennis]|nr:hypothetical protein J6590_026800 [Homalodisca vitripennis]